MSTSDAAPLIDITTLRREGEESRDLAKRLALHLRASLVLAAHGHHCSTRGGARYACDCWMRDAKTDLALATARGL